MAAITRYTTEMIDAAMEGGYWRPELTVDFWERWARAMPDHPALADSSQELTWRQAVAAIDRVAVRLLDLGFARDDRILVHAGNSVELAVFRLACEKAGVVPVFQHVAFRRREIEWIVSLTQPTGALIQATHSNFDYVALYRELQADHPRLHTLMVDRDGPSGLPAVSAMITDPSLNEAVEGTGETFATRRFRPFEMTGVVTSSGTTGLPKCIEYGPWARLAAGRVYIGRLRLRAGDVVASLIPLYTGGGDLQFHTTPQVGAKLVLLESFSPANACALLERHKATGVILVPTMLSRLLSYAGLSDHDLSCLRFIVCGGGVLPYELGARAEDRLGAKIIQGYGLMDFGALASHGIDDPRESRLRNNGRPLDGNEVRVLGPDGCPLPRGSVGEICAAGVHTNGGYIGNPEATADAWRGGHFRTGDIGYVDEDGYVVLQGRSKEIIIRGGQNISATEVESILTNHPAISEVAVVRMPDEELGERACAFVVPAGERPPSLADIVTFMNAEGVAAFKIPERLEVLESLPLTAGGNKVDKRVLENHCADGVTVAAEKPSSQDSTMAASPSNVTGGGPA